MKPDEVLQVLEDASDALSHASYCAITGTRVREEAIRPQWDRLRDLILCLSDVPSLVITQGETK